jgi:hypothetical protein
MMHYWMFDEDTGPIYHDIVGSSTAEGTSTPSAIVGMVNGAQHFDGTNELDIMDDGSFDWSVSESFTIEFWMKKESGCEGTVGSNYNNVIVGRYGSGGYPLSIWWVGVNCNQSDGPPGAARFVLRGEPGVMLVSNTVLIGENWHHIVAIRDYDENENRLYVDGDLEASQTYTYSEGFEDVSNINVGHIDFGDGYRYNGDLDELAFYSRALTEPEIETHYNNGLAGRGYCFGCGDCNGSQSVDIDDIVYLIAFIFAGGPAPVPYESGNVDCSLDVDIDDVVYLIAYIFTGGPEPCHDCPQLQHEIMNLISNGEST